MNLIFLFFPRLFFISLIALQVSCQTLETAGNSIVDEKEKNQALSHSESEQTSNKASQDELASANYPDYPLTAEFLYDYLLAGLAIDRGEFDIAFEKYKKLAEQSKDLRIVKQLVRAALSSMNDEKILAATKLWEQFEADNLHLHQINTVVLIKSLQDEKALISLKKYINLFNQMIKKQQATLFDKKISDKKISDIKGREKKELAIKDKKNEGILKVDIFLSSIEDEKRVNAFFEGLNKAYPDSFELQLLWAKFAKKFALEQLAKEKIQHALILKPHDTTALLVQLEILAQAKEKQDMNSLYENAIAQAEKPSVVHLVYAKYLLEQKRHKKAMKHLQLVADDNKGNKNILYEIGLLATEIKDYNTAESFFKQIYQQKEHQSQGAYLLGSLNIERNDEAKALYWFEKVKDGTFYYKSVLNQILLLEKQKKFHQALKVIEHYPADSEKEKQELLLLKADLLFQSKAYDLSYSTYTQALDSVKQQSEILFHRAMVAEKMNKIDLMEQDLRQVIVMEPNNANALNTLGFLLTEKTERYKEAQNLIKKALKIKPDDAAIIDSMGWVLYKQGKATEALSHLQRAFKIDQDPEITAHYGEVLWVLNQQEQAKNIWSKGLIDHPEHELLKATYEQFVKP